MFTNKLPILLEGSRYSGSEVSARRNADPQAEHLGMKILMRHNDNDNVSWPALIVLLGHVC